MLKTVYHKQEMSTIGVLSGLRCHERYRPSDGARDSSKILPYDLTIMAAWITQSCLASIFGLVVAFILFHLGFLVPWHTPASSLMIFEMCFVPSLLMYTLCLDRSLSSCLLHCYFVDSCSAEATIPNTLI